MCECGHRERERGTHARTRTHTPLFTAQAEEGKVHANISKEISLEAAAELLSDCSKVPLVGAAVVRVHADPEEEQ